jgi:hypothetical protein
VRSASISSRIFTQNENSHHVHDIGISSEFSEVKNTLLSNDASDQEGNQHHDWNCLPANAIEIIDSGRRAQRTGPQHCSCDRHANSAEHREKESEVDVKVNGGVADAFERGSQPVFLEALNW